MLMVRKVLEAKSARWALLAFKDQPALRGLRVLKGLLDLEVRLDQRALTERWVRWDLLAQQGVRVLKDQQVPKVR